MNIWIFQLRKCQNTQIYYFDALVSISTNLCRTSVYFFINFCCWIPMLAVAHYELIWKWANVLKTLKLSLFLSSNLNLLSVISVISCNTMLSRKFLPDQCRAILTFFLRQAKKVSFGAGQSVLCWAGRQCHIKHPGFWILPPVYAMCWLQHILCFQMFTLYKSLYWKEIWIQM